MIDKFWQALSERGDAPRLLECGTLRRAGHDAGQRAEFLRRFPQGTHAGTDLVAGEGVDVVADLHDLSRVGPPYFDACLCCSVLEHVRRPWVVARQLALACRQGAVLYVQTHQTFPLHDYPGDYFRFSADALRELFREEVGWEVVGAGHEFPCKVVPLENAFAHASGWNFGAEAFLNSWILCERA